MNANTRRAVYGISLTVIALLVGYNILAADKAPLWIALVGSIVAAFGPVTALQHVTPDPIDPGSDYDEGMAS